MIYETVIPIEVEVNHDSFFGWKQQVTIVNHRGNESSINPPTVGEIECFSTRTGQKVGMLDLSRNKKR